MKKNVLILILFLFLLLPVRVFSANDVNVSTTIDSRVSKANSTVVVNPTETLADPASHSISVTVTLKDASGNLLPGIVVVVTSSRGQVDIIEAVSTPNGKTDANGQASFKVTSFVPGEAVLTVTADTLIVFDPVKVTFDPLPFPTNLTVSLTNPITGKRMVIYSPKEDVGQGLTDHQLAAKKLVNSGMEIKISFWLFLIFILVLLLCPLFIVLNYINLRKIRAMEKEQSLLLEKMVPTALNSHIPTKY